jgi:hypothetical protein
MTPPTGESGRGLEKAAAMPSEEMLEHIRQDIPLATQIEQLDLPEADILSLLAKYERFNPTAQVHDGTRYNVDHNYFVRSFVASLPPYIAAGRTVGLSEKRIAGMAKHVLDRNPFELSGETPPFVLHELGVVFETRAGRQEPITSQDYNRLKRLISLTGKYGVMIGAAHALVHTTRLGLSVEQAAQIIGHLPDADGHMSSYAIGYFNEALASLIPAPVNPDDVTEIFAALSGERPYFRTTAYRDFEELVIFDSPAKRRSPQALLEILKACMAGGSSIDDAMMYVAEDQSSAQLTAGPDHMVLIEPAADIERYFYPKNGELEILGLPYRVKRSFAEGLQDLTKIATATRNDPIKSGEGMWVFDQESETWYSLSGKTQILEGRVRTYTLPYDVSLLSKTPPFPCASLCLWPNDCGQR